MIETKNVYSQGLTLHGQKCPPMPVGLRGGAAAFNALGIERAASGQHLDLLELGEDLRASARASRATT